MQHEYPCLCSINTYGWFPSTNTYCHCIQVYFILLFLVYQPKRYRQGLEPATPDWTGTRDTLESRPCSFLKISRKSHRAYTADKICWVLPSWMSRANPPWIRYLWSAPTCEIRVPGQDRPVTGQAKQVAGKWQATGLSLASVRPGRASGHQG